MLRSAFLGVAEIVFLATRSQLHGVWQRMAIDVFLVDLGVALVGALPLVDALRRNYPSVPIVGAIRWPHDVRALLPAARLGLSDVLLVGHEEPQAALVRTLDGVRRAGPGESVWHALSAHIPRSAAPIVRCAIDLAWENPPVTRVGFAVHCSPKTLARRLMRAGLPQPATLLAWCRVLVAARLLEHRTRTVEQVAQALRYSAPSALRRSVARLVGLRPMELRAAGGLRHAVDCFVRTLPPTRSLHDVAAVAEVGRDVTRGDRIRARRARGRP